MKRRSLLKKIALGASLLMGSLLPYGVTRMLSPAFAKPDRNYLRPPGALKDDAEFISACIACGLCGEICPPKCIKFNKQQGGTDQNTPYIDPTEKACILCDKCMEVCPTNALSLIERTEIDMGIAFIDQTACYPWVDRGICGACVSICPVGDAAIGFKMWNQYRPIIREGCVGCGICVEVCPHPSRPIWTMDRPERNIRAS